MTRQAVQSGDISDQLQSVFSNEAPLAGEIRIVQSVQNQRNMPAILIGSISSIILVLMINWHLVLTGYIKYPLLVSFLLLLAMLRSYLKLYGRPLPRQVSLRRIRTIEIYTMMMGLVWAVTVLLVMAAFSPIDATVSLLVMFFLAYGSTALSPSLPRASLLFSIPVMLACLVAGLMNQILDAPLLIFLCIAASTVILRTTLQNWHDVTQRVRLGQEALQAESRRAEIMEQISQKLSKYMSPQLYQSIFTGAEKVEIMSKRKKLTVFFSDIARFAEITEQLQPEELTELLNRYLTEMSQIVVGHGGTIDKFIGDAIVVYFGDVASRGVKEDAANCVSMAMAMQQKVRELGNEWIGLGLERTFELRIGINTGFCTIGNFGSIDRMDYTIFGSEVNLAARLEAAADIGGILLANETYSMVRDRIDASELNPLNVKGFSKPIKCFRVNGVLENGLQKNNSIRHDSPGLSLALEPSQMAGLEKDTAIKALKSALGALQT